jgi:hypothetical protein
MASPSFSVLPISEVHLNEQNPRILKDDRFKQLVQSLQDFPEMLSLRPLVVDEGGVVLGGNMRLRALQHVKSWTKKKKQGAIEHAVFHRGLVLDAQGNTVEEASPEQKDAYRAALDALFFSEEVLVSHAPGLSPAQKREFVLKDNANFGDWDWEQLANDGWGDAAALNSWGLEVPKDWSHEVLAAAPEILGEISLPSGEAPAFTQMTFTLTKEQAQDVETALSLAKGEEGYDWETGNDNSNGNALAFLAQQFNSTRNSETDEDDDGTF